MKEIDDMTLSELKEHARMGMKFETMREQYNATADRISVIISELQSIVKEINPVSAMRTRANSIHRKDAVQDIYLRMKQGTQVTAKLIESMYPDMSPAWIGNTMISIRKLPRVHRALDGRKARLFYQE